jgi:hypothetical protein
MFLLTQIVIETIPVKPLLQMSSAHCYSILVIQVISNAQELFYLYDWLTWVNAPGAQVEKVDMSRAVPVPVEDVCSNTDSNNDINSSSSSSNSSTNTGEIGEGTRGGSVS